MDRKIYTKERYEGRISRRTNNVSGKSFVEETLPVEVESVEEYFEHFRVLEIDRAFAEHRKLSNSDTHQDPHNTI